MLYTHRPSWQEAEDQYADKVTIEPENLMWFERNLAKE